MFVLELSGQDETLTGPDEVIVSGSAGSNQKCAKLAVNCMLYDSRAG